MAVVPIDGAVPEPYASIVCYPKVSKSELSRRLKQLRRLEITALRSFGQKQVLNTWVLGKGCVGIVMLAYKNGEKVALKIRRTDADRASMRREARLLERANRVGVGPKLIDVCKDFLVMQFVDGKLLPEWLEKEASKALVIGVLRDVLEQCWRLDAAGLDHGELSHAPKHILVDNDCKTVIVDFESASTERRPANVTSACQFLLFDEAISGVAKMLGLRDKKLIIDFLRSYKKDTSRASFERLLESCGFR